MTKQREVILKIIHEAGQHKTAEQIFMLAKQQLPSIAVGTVYNNLNALCSDGTITRIRMAGQPDRFDRAPLEKAHHHMVCDMCGRIEDLVLTDLNQYLCSHCQAKINSVELTVHYTCENCLNDQAT